jgi:fructose-bisphosphate aldolase class I
MIATPGRGILAVGESNVVGGLRRASIGLQNAKVDAQVYGQVPRNTPSLGEYVSAAIVFEETVCLPTTEAELEADYLKE